MQKNGTLNPQDLQNAGTNSANPLGGGLSGLGSMGGLGGFGSLGGLGGFGGLGGMGGFGSPNLNNNTSNPGASVTSTTPSLNPNPFGNMTGNPLFPMMGSGFGMNQGMYFPNSQTNPFSFSNPLLSNSGLNPSNLSSNPTNLNSSAPQNNLMSMLQNLQTAQQKASDELKFSGQIKELNIMGFSDK